MKAAAYGAEEQTVSSILQLLEDKAKSMQAEDVAINTAMSEYGAEELAAAGKPLTILTHCNAGALATAGVGTALGVTRSLHKRGLIRMVYADETRPLLQGARLTVSELMADGIPVTLIRTTGRWVMRRGVDAVVVGADRITANETRPTKSAPTACRFWRRNTAFPFTSPPRFRPSTCPWTKGNKFPLRSEIMTKCVPFREYRRRCRKPPSLIRPST